MNGKEHAYLAYNCTGSEALKELISLRILARLGALAVEGLFLAFRLWLEYQR